MPGLDIIATAEAAAIAAVKDYENMSRCDHTYIPEYWITCRIASDLAAQGLVVLCEKRITEMDINEKLGGRIDLAVYEPADENQGPRLSALIEVKGPQTTWPSFSADFDRLSAIAESPSSLGLVIGLLYVTPTMTAAALDFDEKRMKERLVKFFCHEKTDFLRKSERQHLHRHHKDRTPGVDDVWEILSVFRSRK
jgi:hypothetical protein